MLDHTDDDETPVKKGISLVSDVYKVCGSETNYLKSFSDRVQEELNVFYTKVS